MRRHCVMLLFVTCGACHARDDDVDMSAPFADASANTFDSGFGDAFGDALAPTTELPPIPLGYDAYRRWDLWPRLRIGARTYMRSTFDRTGGNEGADASHFLRQDDAAHNVALDVAGTGALLFARANRWHGSPWRYIPDGTEHIVQESATANPTMAVPNSTWLPADTFASPFALTWSTTNGGDISWVPIPFQTSLELAYERTCYGTGYFIYTLVADAPLLTPLVPFSETAPPADAATVLTQAGQDLVPSLPRKTGTVALAANVATPVVTLNDAPAQIRALSFTIAATDADAFAGTRVRIRWDGEATPSVDAPIALFFGTGTLYNRANIEYLVKSLPAVVQFAGGNIELSMYFPMPYFASAAIELEAPSSIGKVAWRVASEPYTDPPAWSGTFHATYVDHGTPVAGNDLVFLDTTKLGGDFCGHVVGTSFIFSDVANLGTLEGDPRFFFDDSETPQVQGTGTEEWGGGGDYWDGQTMTQPLVGHPVGAPSVSSAKSTTDQIESAYRFLLADVMPFGKNARVQLEHGATDTSTDHYQSVTYWYARPGACLVQTDALHVSDTTDETAHAYSSPTASSVDSLTSRYELGVDHVGATQIYAAVSDTGRHMTGTTSLRLAIDPDNVGVLLRRKLDQHYADQRAEVYVSDDVDGATFVHAGTWYTAGSNTVVYSNPSGELDPPSNVIETSNRQWRDDELILPRALTQGRSHIRVQLRFVPGSHALTPGATLPPSAWSEYRYTAYSWLLPR